MPDWTTYKGQTPWENPVMRKKTSYNEGALIADSRNPVWQYPEWRTTPVTDKHLPCGYWDAKQNAMVVFNITPPVGYDTWTCDGVEYQGKIVTVGAGMMYATPLLGVGIVHGLPPYTKKGLVLIYPGTYIRDGFNMVTATGAGYYTFVRGVGSVEDVVVAGSPAALAGGHSTNIIEGLYLQNNYSLGYPPFMVSDGAGSCIYNKCKSSQISLHSTAWFGSNSVLDMRYCTCISPASSGYGTIYSSYASTDNTKSHLRKTYISEYFGLYGGTGSLGTEDYVEEATVGYGHEYGDYLISDWEFDGTKRKLSYEGGTAVDVSAGGYFTLTNTKREFINVYVEAASLPSVDRTLTIYNDRYTDGVKII
jgi:hypothetical protein